MLLPRCCNLASIHEVLPLSTTKAISLAHALADEQVYTDTRSQWNGVEESQGQGYSPRWRCAWATWSMPLMSAAMRMDTRRSLEK